MEDLFDQMFFLDRELKKSIISNQNPNVIWRQIVDIEEQMKTANANPLSAWLDYDFDLFKDVEIPLHILRNSSAFAKAGRIYEYDRNVVDAYYLNKFGIDVSKVEITTILNIPEHAEAFAMSCGSDEHYVVIGRNLRSAFLSYDLLIHEFGHTVEFIEGRKNKKIDEFLKLNVLSEAIAHLKTMSEIPIELPPLDEQKEIVRRVEELFTFANNIEQKVITALQRVNSLPQSILGKAFRGDLTGSWRDANLDLISGENSAEVLLGNIKKERETIKKQLKLKQTTLKKKAGKPHMSQQIIKVAEALKKAGEPLSGQQLLAASGYPTDSSTDQLEQFFLDIRNALTIERSIVKLYRDEDSQDWFDLANDSQQ